MKRREFLGRSAGVAAGAWAAAQGITGCATAGGAGRARQPNVVLLFADDLGYAEIGVHGGRDVPTPHIDSIARSGVRCTQGYVSCPVCSPTRAGLLTGRYQQRFGHEFNPGNAQEAAPNFGLPLTETTIADRLRTAGYRTGLFGKWHLGYTPSYYPTRRGFDEFYGFLAGARDYFPSNKRGVSPLMRGEAVLPEDFDYTTFAFAREAADFIRRNKETPFFAFVSFNAVHGPLQAPEEYLTRFAAIQDGKRRTFAAMLSAMDDAVGMVLQALDANGLRDDTLVFFVSDNGGPTQQTTSSNDPLRAMKGSVYEGGIRVPFLVQWPGRLRAGSVYEEPVIALDILPTAVAAAGAVIDAAWKLDGVDLAPYLTGARDGAPHEALYWRFGEQWAVRQGDWKLLAARGDGASPELYHLKSDAGESRDRAESEVETRKRLAALYDTWNAQLVEPLWGPKGGAVPVRRRPARAPRPGRARRQ